MRDDEIEIIIKDLPSKSARIRALDKAGLSKAEIGRALGISYQFVYNVLRTPVSARHLEAERRVAPTASPVDADAPPLTIDQAKRGLAAHFGVSPDAIEITIRG